MATSIGRTRSSAADIAESPADFDDFVGMASLMVEPMRDAPTWKPLGTVTQQIAAKLIALREVQDKKAVALQSEESATAKCPGREESGAPRSRTGDGGAATPGGDRTNAGSAAAWRPADSTCQQSAGGLDAQEGGPARPNLPREANWHVRRAMQASEGK